MYCDVVVVCIVQKEDGSRRSSLSFVKKIALVWYKKKKVLIWRDWEVTKYH